MERNSKIPKMIMSIVLVSWIFLSSFSNSNLTFGSIGSSPGLVLPFSISSGASPGIVSPTTLTTTNDDNSGSGELTINLDVENDQNNLNSNERHDPNLITTIRSVRVDGVSLNPTTDNGIKVIERNIRFTFTGPSPDLPGQTFETFRCRLINEPASEDNPRPPFTNCTSPIEYNNLDILPGDGTKRFEVFARATIDDNDNNDNNDVIVEGDVDSFTWQIVSANSPDIGREASEVEEESKTVETTNQILANEEAARGNLQTLENTLQQEETADQISNTINTPFKECDGDFVDYAVYNVHGSADVSDIFGSGIIPSGYEKKDVPVALILFNDLQPTEHKNIILNNNQPFIRAELVAFPGDSSNQRSTNYEIKKITTDCKINALVGERQELGTDENVNTADGGDSAAIVKQRTELNPPFSRCIVTAGAGTPPGLEQRTDAGSVLDFNPNPNIGALSGDVNNRFRSDDSINNNQIDSINNEQIQSDVERIQAEAETIGALTGLNEEQEQQIEQSRLLAESGRNAAALPSSITQEAPGPATGDRSDVAKYIIAGTVDLENTNFEGGRQDTVLRLYNIFDPTKAPEFLTANTKNSNNLFMTARLEVDPGNTDSWEILFMGLTEVSTECLAIPFVSSPKTIGTSGSDFFTS